MRREIVVAFGLLAGACDTGGEVERPLLPYASEVVSFEPGPGAGFGQDELPGVVLGPPVGYGPLSGSLDVVSLGQGGEIVLGFGAREVVDRPGDDLVVFENAFWAGGDPAAVFAEPGEVAVSEDGETWHAFPCDAGGDGEGGFEGCAGWTPTLELEPEEVVPIDPAATGGDAFDLADLGLERIRYVRIRDVSGSGDAPSSGFDLDAVGAVHIEAAE